MDSPEQIPLGEAVARGIIPCSVCGAKGADVRKVGDRNHFLCSRCAGRGRAWTWLLVGFTVIIVGLAGYLLSRGKKPADPAPPSARGQDPEPWMKETVRLLDMKRYAEARVRIQELLDRLPTKPEVNFLMGKCLMGLKAYEAAIPPLRIAYASGPPLDEQSALFLALALRSIGHCGEALTYYELLPAELRKNLSIARAEALLDLERYDEALQLLPEPNDPGTLWARHRALLYSGKGEEARKLAEGRDPFLLVGQLREEGDFAGAVRILESNSGPRALKAGLIVAIESGDLAKVDASAAELTTDDAPFFRAIARLLAGRKDAAATCAWEFLAKTDKEYSPLRMERMMMRHLVGELKDADLEAEAKLQPRSQANDLFWYLALVSGDRAWAEKALAATPGHNYPYHSIRRILTK